MRGCPDHFVQNRWEQEQLMSPFYSLINNSLVAGKNIDWMITWKELGTKFTDAASKEKVRRLYSPIQKPWCYFY